MYTFGFHTVCRVCSPLSLLRIALSAWLALCVCQAAHAQDGDTRLLLRFDDSEIGHNGQTPVSAPGALYQPGAIERCVSLPPGSTLAYLAAGNIGSQEGTLEFWIRPNWSGNDGQTHAFVAWGESGGMIFLKDGAGSLRAILNRFGAGGQPERGVAFNVNSWASGVWRHVAFTWSNTAQTLELYVDGSRVAFTTFTGVLPSVTAETFSVGSENGVNDAAALLDHVRISSSVRTSAQIVESFRAGPLLTLPFENSMVGSSGDTPTMTAGVSYEAGVNGQGVYLGVPNQVFYPAASNVLATEGTFEVWMKPRWSGNDNLTHTLLTWGGTGGVLFTKDGANNLRAIFNRFSSEIGVAINVGSWTANSWHHVAYTWSNTSHQLELYVDGTRVGQTTFAGLLPAVSNTTFQLGGDGSGNYASAVFDQLRVTGRARTATEIADSFLAGLTVSSLTVNPGSVSMYPTWRRAVTLSAVTNVGTVSLPGAIATWSTSNDAVAVWDGTGIRAIGPGSATLTATYGAASGTVAVTVTAPARAPDITTISANLSTPASCYQWEMPVAILRYIPTTDGVTVDAATAGWGGTVDALKASIDRLEVDTKFMLEEGSRFRGYGSQTPAPSLGYRVVAIINVYEPIPPDLNPAHGTGTAGVYYPDYNQILERWNAAHWVNDLGVKEVWMWGYHNGPIAPVESNMSSPLTGDISNSYRFNDDLPIYSKSYVLYNYNYTRSQAEAVHNHGHQLEAALSYVAARQDGNDQLFWRKFVGQNNSGQFVTGRCGWTHMPPNTVAHYDYENAAVVMSDARDWTPAGTGVFSATSANTWGTMSYLWPGGVLPSQRIESQFYMFWMQSMPGLGNIIPHGSNRMTNWWWFTGDWDAAVTAVRANWGLHFANSGTPPTISAQPPENVQVCTGGAVQFTMSAAGASPLSYQWLRDGLPLCNGGRFRGVCSPLLSIDAVEAGDAAHYSVLVTSPGGSVSSTDAVLAVVDAAPQIQQHPASVLRCPRGPVSFTVAMASVGQHAYQWQIESPANSGVFVDLESATFLEPQTGLHATVTGQDTSTLVLSNVLLGSHARVLKVRVRVANMCSAVVSEPALFSACKADFDCTGMVSIDDLFIYLNAWFTGANSADIDSDGASSPTIDDLFLFINLWFTGC